MAVSKAASGRRGGGGGGGAGACMVDVARAAAPRCGQAFAAGTVGRFWCLVWDRVRSV